MPTMTEVQSNQPPHKALSYWNHDCEKRITCFFRIYLLFKIYSLFMLSSYYPFVFRVSFLTRFKIFVYFSSIKKIDHVIIFRLLIWDIKFSNCNFPVQQVWHCNANRSSPNYNIFFISILPFWHFNFRFTPSLM